MHVHQAVDVSQNFRDCAIQMRWNLLTHVSRLIQRLGQRRIFDEWYLMLHGALPDTQRASIH